MCPWLNMDNEHTRQEIVKCVVVGDTAVGKTRLICARACNAYLSLSQLLSTHIPTVWAIDQYRIHKEVLRRSWKVVDGVHVSLRLWDTFGDHEKDRRFAYGRSDVVLLCFSISNRLSLRNCKTKWFPEIRHYCPHTPIVLVGCKNDLRHIYRDQSFLNLCREKSPFIRILQENDLTTRDQGRIAAEEIEASYYEASVLTQYGIEEIFENAVRVALLARKQQRFWVKNLKNVQQPIPQMPYCPPRPPMPELEILHSSYVEDMLTLLDKARYTDVKLAAGNAEFPCHSLVLSAASPHFRRMISNLLKNPENSLTVKTFQWVKPATMHSFLRFLYSSFLDVTHKCISNLLELMELARATNMNELEICLRNVQNHESYMNYEVQEKYFKKLKANMREICLHAKQRPDVIFELDDGNCAAHKAVLRARSDVMEAMFNGNFKESSAKIVRFPGVPKHIFQLMLVYLYADKLEKHLSIPNYLPLLTLANRLCLNHFISVIEDHAVFELSEISNQGANIAEHVCHLLEPCQVHNACQLSEWCQYYIAINYHEISSASSRLLRMLHPENQAYLNKNRWPPASYLKEVEYYDRCVRERELSEKPQQLLRWKRASKKVNTGCFWFRSRSENRKSHWPASM